MNLDMVDSNSETEEFTCIWQSYRVGIITIKTEKVWIHFSSDFFVAVSRSRGILNSWFMKAWSMQALIPVVSSSLYCWLSVFKIPLREFQCFSFWVGSSLKWGVYIKLKVFWLRAFLWCMSQTSRDRCNNHRVRTHRKNSGDSVRWLGKIIKSIFVPNQETAFAWPFGNGPVIVGTQGLFCLCLKTFVAPFLPARLTAPRSPRIFGLALALLLTVVPWCTCRHSY